jgi:hypothetical protein
MLLGLMALAERSRASSLEKWADSLRPALSLRWFYRSTLSLLVGISRVMQVFSSLLEGRAGLLWALLVVALLLSLIAQFSGPS